MTNSENILSDRTQYIAMIEEAGSANTETPFQVTIIGKVWFIENILTPQDIPDPYVGVVDLERVTTRESFQMVRLKVCYDLGPPFFPP